METIASIAPGHAGILVWLVWGLIGLFEGMAASRVLGGNRILFLDAVIGIVAGGLGGIFTTNFIGDTPIQLFLVSILGVVFFSAAALWIVGLIFYRNSEK